MGGPTRAAGTPQKGGLVRIGANEASRQPTQEDSRMRPRMHSHPVVAHIPEGQALSGGNGRTVGPVSSQEDSSGIAGRAPPPAYIHQETHDSTHHLVAEGICPNIEYSESAILGCPLRGEQISMAGSNGLTFAFQRLSTKGRKILFPIQRITGQIHEWDR